MNNQWLATLDILVFYNLHQSPLSHVGAKRPAVKAIQPSCPHLNDAGVKKLDLPQDVVFFGELNGEKWGQGETEPEMLEMNTDKVCFVIIKAREYDIQDEELTADDTDDSNATDDHFVSIFEHEKDNSVRKELTAFIDSMDEDEQCELVALCWLGRGDFTTQEWKTAVEEARSRRQGSTAKYLMGIPLVSDYLEEGLSQFDLSCEGFEMGHL